MATRKPLVIIAGQVQELPAGDSVGEVAAITSYYEPMLATNLGNQDVVYIDGDALVPDFVLSSDGDIIMGLGA
jgi:hypothetical protein